MDWIIGKLVGAAFPGAGLIVKALSLTRSAGKWITESSTHLLIAALALALAFGAWERHEARHWHGKAQTAKADEAARWKPIVEGWQRTETINHHSINVLELALVDQNAQVIAFMKDGDAAKARTHAALQAASQRAKASEALSARMKAVFALSAQRAAPDGQCKTDPSVMAAAKGGAL